MAKPKAQRLIALEQEWARRYGEPPAIMAGAALLAKILRETSAEKKP